MYLYLDTQYNENEMETIRDYCENYKTEFAFIYAINTDLFSETDKHMKPTRMLYVGGVYLLENVDGIWHMGEYTSKSNEYSFWGKYGDLEKTLKSL